MTDLLKLDSVTLKFGGHVALSDLTWVLPKTDHHRVQGIIGPNGAGKSTLFNLITGIYKPTTGRLSFDGDDIDAMPTSAIARCGIARTFQNIRLLPHLSILDNLRVVGAVEREGSFWSSLFQLPRGKRLADAIEHRAYSLLQWVGLASVSHLSPETLPYGDQRKLEIARALMRKPKLLLLDEPAAGMNATEKQDLENLIRKVMTQDLTILIIEHDMKFIMSLCSQITVLDQGSLCAQGTPAEIQSNSKVIACYLGKPK
jgi:branched-chain amino acid transport system ATP-binding protein